MEKITTAIIGGGAAGLFLSSMLCLDGEKTILFERGERVGRKLSATGNGQGNVTNVNAGKEKYFSSTAFGARRGEELIARYGAETLFSHLESLGLLLITDERGRVYPAGRQASAITDALRFSTAGTGVEIRTGEKVVGLEKQKNGFSLRAETAEGVKTYLARQVVLCTGGKAAKNFGSDGAGYALAKTLGHTVTPLFPSLVQLKTDVTKTKTLKGIRVADAGVTAVWRERGKEQRLRLTGDVLFTEYGISGDAIFRISAFVADKISDGVEIFVDFLPQFTQEKVLEVLSRKRATFPNTPFGELLCGIVNNQVGRAVMKCVALEDLQSAARLVKAFPIRPTGTLGFDYAQVTKGGVPLEEVDENLQSKLCEGLYFAGEILDIDGQCGGFNLQWAYASACAVAAAIADKKTKTRGQVCV